MLLPRCGRSLSHPANQQHGGAAGSAGKMADTESGVGKRPRGAQVGGEGGPGPARDPEAFPGSGSEGSRR